MHTYLTKKMSNAPTTVSGIYKIFFDAHLEKKIKLMTNLPAARGRK